jgi:hypothetical protein
MARDPPVFVYRHYIQDKGTFPQAVTHRLAVY